jgi:hypothetical protein
VQGRSAHGRISRDFCQNRPDDVSRASAFAEWTRQDRGTPGAYFCPVHRQAPNRVQATALVCWSFAPADQPGADDKSRPVVSRDGPGRIAIALPDLLGNIGASRKLDVPQSSLKPRHARRFLSFVPPSSWRTPPSRPRALRHTAPLLLRNQFRKSKKSREKKIKTVKEIASVAQFKIVVAITSIT